MNWNNLQSVIQMSAGREWSLHLSITRQHVRISVSTRDTVTISWDNALWGIFRWITVTNSPKNAKSLSILWTKILHITVQSKITETYKCNKKDQMIHNKHIDKLRHYRTFKVKTHFSNSFSCSTTVTSLTWQHECCCTAPSGPNHNKLWTDKLERCYPSIL